MHKTVVKVPESEGLYHELPLWDSCMFKCFRCTHIQIGSAKAGHNCADCGSIYMEWINFEGKREEDGRRIL